MYKATPIDTKHIELPEALLDLTKRIAENVHENWTEGKIFCGCGPTARSFVMKKDNSLSGAVW